MVAQKRSIDLTSEAFVRDLMRQFQAFSSMVQDTHFLTKAICLDDFIHASNRPEWFRKNVCEFLDVQWDIDDCRNAMNQATNTNSSENVFGHQRRTDLTQREAEELASNRAFRTLASEFEDLASVKIWDIE